MSGLPSIFGSNLSIFNALLPRNPSPIQRLLDPSLARGSAVGNVQAAIDQFAQNRNRDEIINTAINRINGVAQEIIEPNAEFERTGGFLAITGQPFRVNVTDEGQIEIVAQTLDDLSSVPPGQQPALARALERLEELRDEVNLAEQRGQFRQTLIGAVDRIRELEDFAPPREPWEFGFQSIALTGKPVLVGLNPDGELEAFDQLETNFDYVEDRDDRLKLQLAGLELQNILDGTSSATEIWQFEALGNKASGDDYFLDIEDGEVIVRRNKEFDGSSFFSRLRGEETNFAIIPDFLRNIPTLDDIAEKPWEREAIDLILDKRPFHIEIIGGRPFIRETDFVNTRRAEILDFSNNALGQAQVNLLV